LKDLSVLSQKVRKYHCEVWQYHDLEAFENLASSAFTLLKLLGFDHQPAKEAADCIKSAYICADKATDAMEVENCDLEMQWYNEAAVQLKRARILLDLKEDGGKYEVKWWYAFRHGDWLEIGKLLFEELFIHTNDPEFALLGAYFLMTATRAHSERKWVEVGTILGQYWSQVLERGYLFLAGGL
jgi:hypothetical protein